MAFCPNISNKQVRREFNELKNKVGKNLAYYLWDKYEGDYELASLEAARIAGNVLTEVIESADSDVNSYDSDYRKKINNRRLNWTAEEIQLSERVSTVLTELFPELSKEYVLSIEGGYIGEVDLDALRILIDEFLEKPDTIPHEYAHYYINMFWDSKLVQEGLTEFGSEEALVTALGQKALESGGKARTWWLKFKDFIKSIFADNKTKRQLLLAELTDGFVTRKLLSEAQEILSGVRHQGEEKAKVLSLSEARSAAATIIQDMNNQITYNEGPHLFIDNETGETIPSVTTIEKEYGYSNYDESKASSQLLIYNDDARKSGTKIHAVLEELLKNKFVRSHHPDISDEALKGLKELALKILNDYDLIASEAILYDKLAKVAGITDLILRDKKTGELVVADFKTKAGYYKSGAIIKGKTKEERAKRGFIWSTSSKFNLKTERDGHDFQTLLYSKILQRKGLDIKRRFIIPIVYSFSDGTITNAYGSKIYGRSEELNKKLSETGTVEMFTKTMVETDVDDALRDSNSKTDFEQVSRRLQFVSELQELIKKINIRLEVQQKMYSAYRAGKLQAANAKYLQDQINSLTEIDALFKFVNDAILLLERRNKQIETRLRLGDDAKWDVDILFEYKQTAVGYNLVSQLLQVVDANADVLGDSTVAKFDELTNKVMSLQNSIIGAYNKYGKQIYLNQIAPYVGNVRNQMVTEEENKYREHNPIAAGQSKQDYENEVLNHLVEWANTHKAEIDYKTKQWLKQQAEVADNLFEMGGIQPFLTSVYQSRDPFVTSAVQIFDSKLNKKNLELIHFKHKQARILKEYWKKYGNPNNILSGAKYRQIFDDFVEIAEDGECYLINPFSTAYLKAVKKAKKEIFKDEELDDEQRRLKFDKWLNENAPILDYNAYRTALKTQVEDFLESVVDEATKKIIKDNIDKQESEKTPWLKLAKDKKITYQEASMLNSIEYEIKAEFRHPSATLYPNTKYDKMMALPDDDPKKQLYMLYKDMIMKVEGRDSVIPNSMLLKWHLPGVKKRGAELYGHEGVKAAWTGIKRGTVVQSDDDIRNNDTFQDEEGKPVLTLTIFYRTPVKEDEQSFDLPTIFYQWYDLAMSYKMKREIQTMISMTSEILNLRYTKFGKIRSLLNNGELKAHMTGTLRMFDAWVDQVFYSNSLKGGFVFKIGNSNKHVDVVKLISKIVLRQNNRVMTLNYVSGVNNMLVGEINQLMEAFAGEDIEFKTYYGDATKEFIKGLLPWVADFNKPAPESKLGKMAEWFDMFDAERDQTLNGFMRFAGKALDSGYITNTIGEHEFQMRFVIAELMKMQAKDENGKVIGRMWDFIDWDENGQIVVNDRVYNFDENQQQKFMIKTRVLLMNMHGNYNERSSPAARQYVIGRAALALRRWIEPAYQRRFAPEHYNNILDRKFSGFYRSAFGYLFCNPIVGEAINYIASKFGMLDALVTIMHWKDLKPHQKRNIIRFVTELGAALIAVIAASLLGSGGGDDDDDDLSYNQLFWSYQLYRLYTDSTFFFNPKSFTTIIKDPLPVITYLTDMQKIITQLAPWNWDEEYKSGHHIIKNKLLYMTIRMIPGVKQWGRLENIGNEFQQYMSGN